MRKHGGLGGVPSAEPEGDLRKLRKQVAALSSELKEAHARIAALSHELARRSADVEVASALTLVPAALEPLLSRLSERERKVAMLFARSGCDKAVAHNLGRAVQTVRNQIASALNKLGLHSRDQLLVLLLSGGHHNGVSDSQDVTIR
jgi:DNA-binding NarL/FixJ family response regulator